MPAPKPQDRLTIAELKVRLDLREEIERRCGPLTQKGGRLVTTCPLPGHVERTPSFGINIDDHRTYHCFGCGGHGDVIDFITQVDGITAGELLAQYDTGVVSMPASRVRPAPPPKAQPDYTVITPVPPTARSYKSRAGGFRALQGDTPRTVPLHRPRMPNDPSQLTVDAEYVYRDADGNLLGYVIRSLIPDAATGRMTKLTPAITWVRLKDGTETWAMAHWPDPMPLYGLDDLARTDSLVPVVIPEGEKAKDAAAALLAGHPFVALSWCGGTNKVTAADWTPVRGRTVILLPDADAVGYAAMLELWDILEGLGCTVFFVAPPEGADKGWDIADARDTQWTTRNVIEWLENSNDDRLDLEKLHTEATLREDALRQAEIAARDAAKAAAVSTTPSAGVTTDTLDALLAADDTGSTDDENDPETAATTSRHDDEVTADGVLLGAVYEALSAGQPSPVDLDTLAAAYRRGNAAWIRFRTVSLHSKAFDYLAFEKTVTDHLATMAEAGASEVGAAEDDIVDVDAEVVGLDHPEPEAFITDVLAQIAAGTADATRLFDTDVMDCAANLALDDATAFGRVKAAMRGKVNQRDWQAALKPVIEAVRGRRREEAIAAGEMPFKALGYDGDVYTFISQTTQQEVSLTTSGMKPATLFRLAEMEVWDGLYGGERGIDWHGAINHIMAMAHGEGILDLAAKRRGVGVWRERNTTIAHLGETVIRDGVALTPFEASSRHGIYSGRSAIISAETYQQTAPLDVEEANKLVRICSQFAWSHELEGHLLAGWFATSIICGSTPWRSHIWLVGPSGSGKSTIIEQIVKKIVGRIGIIYDGTVSEAALRQRAGVDARPIVVDEAEGDSDKAQKRIAAILELARAMSSGGKGGRGTQSGTAMDFELRSQLMLASVNTQLTQRADASRMTVLDLRKVDPTPENNAKFEKLRENIEAVVTDDWVVGLYRRMIEMIDVVIANHAVFKSAISARTRDSRSGDQLATLISGAMALQSDHVFTKQEAADFVSIYGDFFQGQADVVESDEERARSMFMQIPVRIPGTSEERTVGHLLEVAFKVVAQEGLPANEAKEILANEAKIKIEGHTIIIATGSSVLKEGMRRANAPWTQWTNVLARLPGGRGSKDYGCARFSGLGSVRAVAIPAPSLGITPA